MIVSLTALYLGAAYRLERAGRVLPSEEARFDAIVVLGCPVGQDGMASSTLRRRALLAADLFFAGHADTIVLTGGVTRRGMISEAEAAARVLDERGIPRSALRIEDRSLTTRENARCTAALGPFRSVLIVSDAYHGARARLLFQPHFQRVEGAGAVGSFGARAKGSLREVPLYALQRLRSLGAR